MRAERTLERRRPGGGLNRDDAVGREDAGGRRRGRKDVLALGALVAAALCWCAPALVHGTAFGSYDLVLRYGLDQGVLHGVRNVVNGDTARQDAVWAIINWRDVHAGHLPLWDPNLLLGLPELANLQSAPLSVPSLVSYLVPLRFAYTTSVIVRLCIAGSGCYAAARVLRTSRPAALLAGMVGELAGPMAAWAGWPQSAVAAWTGWLVAALLLLLERPSWRRIGALALVVGAAGMSGFPEVCIIAGIAGGILALVAVRARPAEPAPVARAPAPRAAGERRRALLAAACATVLGAALSAPAWLPSLPVLLRSVSVGRIPTELPAGELWLFIDPAYWGSPAPSGWFGPSNYYETAAYVGPAVLALAALALARWRDRRVAAVLVSLAAVFVLSSGLSPVVRLERVLPAIGSVAFGRGLLVVCDLLALAGAIGLDVACRSRRRVLVVVLALAGIPTLLVLFGALGPSLPAAARAARRDGALLGAVPLLGLLALALVPRRARALAASCFVALEVAALIAASAGTNSSASSFLPESPALATAVRDTRGALVALGGEHPAGRAVQLGVMADLNAPYGLHELAGYDGTIPRAEEQAWAAVAPAPALAHAEIAHDLTSFDPPVTTVREARALGVRFILEPARPAYRLVADARAVVGRALGAAGLRSPTVTAGMLDALEWWCEQPVLIGTYEPRTPASIGRYLASVAHTTLSEPIPLAAAAPAAASVLRQAGAHPGLLGALRRALTDAPPGGTVLVAHLGGEQLRRFRGVSGVRIPRAVGRVRAPLSSRRATARFSVTLRRPAWVDVAITNEPGWVATVNGAPAPLRPGPQGATLRVRLPVGRDSVRLSYWPALLTPGLAAAATAALLLAAALFADTRRRAAPSALPPPSSLSSPR